MTEPESLKLQQEVVSSTKAKGLPVVLAQAPLLLLHVQRLASGHYQNSNSCHVASSNVQRPSATPDSHVL